MLGIGRSSPIEGGGHARAPLGLRVVLIAYALIAAIMAWFFLFGQPVMAWFTREDGVVENLGFLLFLASAGFMVSSFWRSINRDDLYLIDRNKWWYLLFGIGFFVLAMEEISWGQRVFGVEAQSWQAVNEMSETNIHNLLWFKNVRSGMPSFLQSVFYADAIFSALLFVMAVILPLAYWFSSATRRLMVSIGFPMMALPISCAIVLSFIIPEIFERLDSDGSHHAWREIQEFLYALALAGFAWLEMRRAASLSSAPQQTLR